MNFIVKYLINREINKIQEEINCEYEKYGATEEIIDKQADINTVRHIFNIPDDNEKIYKEFVQ